MQGGQIQVVRRVWDAGTQGFVVAREAMADNPASLEKVAAGLSGPLAPFLKGPIPWLWVVAAAGLPGQALVVGLCLWRLSGAMRSRTVMLGNNDLQAIGVGRSAKSRALADLEAAGLISVVHVPGRFPLVTLPEFEVPQAKRRSSRDS